MKFKAIFAGIILTILGMPAFAQGNSRGLGGSDSTIMSIGERLFNLEKKNKAFQLFFNMKFDYTENIVATKTTTPVPNGAFHGTYFRPEIKGIVGKDDKWGYRIRLNMKKSLNGPLWDGLSEFVDYLALYYKPNEHWSFAFGKGALAYGTFEHEWNPLNVIQYHEMYDRIPCLSGIGADVCYTVAKQTFGLEIANALRKNFYEVYIYAADYYEQSTHPLQYTFNWEGHFLNDRIKTLWSYTLINQAKGSITHQVALGQLFSIGKWDIQLDYIGAWGRLDYLQTISNDAQIAGYFEDPSHSHNIDGTGYNSVLVDIGFRPTPRWNLFVKTGVTSSSADNIKEFNRYRYTFEYTGAVQFFIDTTQDFRVSLAYIGKHIYFNQLCGLENQNYGRIELSLIYRLKAF